MKLPTKLRSGLTFTAKLLLKLADYDNSTIQFVYGPDVSKRVKDFAKTIKREDIYTDKEIEGLENNIHTTVLYGIKGTEPKSDKKLPELPLELEWVGLGKFTPAEKPYDVLLIKLDKTPELQELFDQINDNYPDNVNSYPEYVPHTTVAYLKKGMADKYIKANPDLFKEVVTDFIREFAFNENKWKV